MSAQRPGRPASAPDRRDVRSWTWIVLTDAVRIIVLGVAALGIGWTLNGMRRQPLAWNYRSPAQRLQAAVNHLRPPVSAAVPLPSPMDLEAFQAFAAAHRGVVIDARAPAFYRLGHVPGAVNLPRENFAAAYEDRRTALDPRRKDGAAIYCSEEDCPDAELIAEALGRLGFGPLWVYRPGWDEWVRAGLPQEGTPPP